MVDVLEKLLQIDKAAARIIYAGLGILAAAAIALSWKDIDIRFAMWIGVYIVALGGLLLVLGNVFGDPLMQKVLGWAIIVAFVAYLFAFLASALAPNWAASVGIAPAPCLVKPWLGCKETQDAVAINNYTPPPAVEAPRPSPAFTAFVVPRTPVFVQFAGEIRRDDVKGMMAKLQSAGWSVQGVAGGGERTGKAAGINVVRYKDATRKTAAEALARQVQEINLTGKKIGVEQSAAVSSDQLEVWISR